KQSSDLRSDSGPRRESATKLGGYVRPEWGEQRTNGATWISGVLTAKGGRNSAGIGGPSCVGMLLAMSLSDCSDVAAAHIDSPGGGSTPKNRTAGTMRLNKHIVLAHCAYVVSICPPGDGNAGHLVRGDFRDGSGMQGDASPAVYHSRITVTLAPDAGQCVNRIVPE